MNEEQTKRLIEVIDMAYKLKWILSPVKGQSYLTMQLPEVEKCMVVMVDDFEFKRMKEWKKDAQVSVSSV